MNQNDRTCEDRKGDPRVTGDPTDIGHAGELVIGMDVKDILDGQCCAKEVATSSVDDTLGLASRARGLPRQVSTFQARSGARRT